MVCRFILPSFNIIFVEKNMVSEILPSVERHACDTVKTLFEFITAQGDADYIGEAVSQLEHSLQAAQLARDAGADRDTILGALLHDVGRFIPAAEKMPRMTASNGTSIGPASHEVLGERYLREIGFSETVCQLVGAHVMAKRYLATDKDYYESLSKQSKATLKYQGGPFHWSQMAEAEKDPLLQAKLAVRRWDDLAKVPGRSTSSLFSYREMAIESLLGKCPQRACER